MFKVIEKIFPLRKAYAHCDIPCGIYDPQALQVAAHTVLRMTSLLKEVKDDPDDNTADFKIARYTAVKEEHAERAKHEARVIWGDYFKPEVLEKFPETTDLVGKIMRTASKARQEINSEAAEELLRLTQEFAEIFFKSKGVKTARVKAPFPTEGDLVVIAS